MRWQQGRRSVNVQDLRGQGGKLAAGGGIGALLLSLLVFFLGGDPSMVTERSANVLQGTSSHISEAEQSQLVDFSSVILAETEDVWQDIYRKNGGSYSEPTLVVYRGVVDSGCGMAQAAMGPFYCPQDQKLYLDLEFFYDMKHKLNASGDFAQAYVIAHEVGHHVQNQLGILDESQRLQRRADQRTANQVSVRTELMADCFAGIWAHHTRQKGILEEGDLEEALNAATQIGDDRLQERARGYAVPDSFTHGSSAQRYEWFKKGFDSGELNTCNTF